jgi:yecA family protein
MSAMTTPAALPRYDVFTQTIAVLGLPISSSELHGVMSAYVSTGALKAGEQYIRALMLNQHDEMTRAAAMALFNLFATTEQQIAHHGFGFELLLPDDQEDLVARAKAFSEWCVGYMQGIRMAGVDFDQFHDEDTQEAFQHIEEFSELDYESIDVTSEDERSLMEVCEYTRVAVLHIFNDLNLNRLEGKKVDDTAH